MKTPRYEYKLPFLSCGGSPQLMSISETESLENQGFEIE
nr:MAG TPA: hypothetical protein [Caudoviricetes sp.]